MWKTKSSFSICFLMMISLEVASLPPMQRNSSEEMNQWNFSYHSFFRFAVRSFSSIRCCSSIRNLFSSLRSFWSFFLLSSRASLAPWSFFFAFLESSK